MLKVLFSCVNISPYRNDFFNHLATLCDLTVCYEVENSEHTHRDKRWFEGLEVNYKRVKLDRKKAFIKFSKGDIIPLLKQGFDIVILGHYLSFTSRDALKYCKKNRIKIGVSADGAKAKKEKLLVSVIKKHLLKKVDFVLSPSKQTDGYFKKYKVSEDKIYRYNFTSLSKKDILPFEPRENKELKVLSVGQFIPRKGFDMLIRIAKNLEAKTVICGAEPTEEYLKLNGENGNKVEFLGFKTKEELKEIYKQSDIFVLPTREDNWGLVINEAMNYSLPIVTTKACVAGVELLDSEWVVDVDEQSIESAIKKLIASQSLREEVGRRNNLEIQSNTIESMAERVFEIIEKV